MIMTHPKMFVTFLNISEKYGKSISICPVNNFSIKVEKILSEKSNKPIPTRIQRKLNKLIIKEDISYPSLNPGIITVTIEVRRIINPNNIRGRNRMIV